ncbi:MAG: GNAT family N-acetyltransferase [Spirosomaceae bacterium]|nr:GNAT family N-acetyltransferase [Spirosomataceae bacterium]
MSDSQPFYTVAEFSPENFEGIANYFSSKNDGYWLGMGIDPQKLMPKTAWISFLTEEYEKPLDKKLFFYYLWLRNGEPIGHSNINKLIIGEEAEMHLHLWNPSIVKQGIGVELLKKTIPLYFEKFKLQRLFCQPFAANPAPNAILPKMGFEFLKTHQAEPIGWINIKGEQSQYILTREKFDLYTALYGV